MREKIVAFFARKEMLKNMAVLTGGTAVAQLLTFFSSPFLSRLYTEEDYGNYGLFTSVISYFVVISCLRLEQAIVIPKSDEEGKSIARWALKITLIVTVFSLLLSLVAVYLFHLSAFFLLIAPTVLFMGYINVYNYYSSRKKAYAYTARSRILTGISLVLTSILLGYFHFGAYGLIGGMFVGQIAGGAYLYFFLHKELYSGTNILSWNELRKKYKQFITINTPHALFDLTESAGVVLLLGLFFDKSSVGAYFFAIRILKVPLGIVGSSIFQVFFRESTEIFVKGKSIFPLYKKLAGRLAIISIPLFALLFLFGEELFGFVFGDEWIESGIYASYFAPWFWLNFIASSVSCIPIVVNKQNFAFLIALFNTIIRLVIIITCGLFYDFEILIYSFAATQTMLMLLNNYLYFYLARKYGKSIEVVDEIANE